MSMSRRAAVLPLARASGSTARSPFAGPSTGPLTTTAAAHLARRATFTASPAIIARIESVGATRWIDEQLNPAAIADSACEAMMATSFPWLTKSSPEIFEITGGKVWWASSMLTRGTLARRLVTNRQLFEVVADVMTNHVYAVAYEKVQDTVVDFDHQVVRRYALGKFSDFLQAAIFHPTMLEFLDNNVSTKSDPNENLGRELLELYTVGTGNYTETDVRNAALLLTGHTFSLSTLRYQFRGANHYLGPLTIMGYSTPNATIAGANAALKGLLLYLARHPATAERLAHRLAVRFVSDTPSPALIAHLVKVYRDNDTSIKAVVRALLLHPEFAASTGQKWRTPSEHMLAMVAAGNPVYKRPANPFPNPKDSVKAIFDALVLASNAPRYWPAVDGYPDVAGYWLTTSSLQQCWAAAEGVAMRRDPEFQPKAWAAVLKVTAGQNVWSAAAAITKQLTGYTWSAADLKVIASLLATLGRNPNPATGYRLTAANITANLPHAVRAIFASPYFMLR